MTERLRVLLLFGGRSAEHDVSRVSAVTAAAALDPERYEVVPVAITKEGRWLLADEARTALDGARASLPAAFAVQGAPVAELSDPTSRELVPLEPGAARRARPGRRSTSWFRCSTVRTARTARSRACSSSPASRTWVPESSVPRWRWTR